jgi:pyruvyltransferase
MDRFASKVIGSASCFLNPSKRLVAKWSHSKETHRNWGDALNKVLIEAISGKTVVHYGSILNWGLVPVYSVIGSVLDSSGARALEVWGSGFKDGGSGMRRAPRRVHAVRGPLTRQRLLQLGVECPEVYGDPALLVPRFLKWERKPKRYHYGIIPHYVDAGLEWVKSHASTPGVSVINIKDGILDVIEKVEECDQILSSSLHGLILSDCLRIPSRWIRLSAKVVGGDFKFLDYFLSVNRDQEEPWIISRNSQLSEVSDFRCSEVSSVMLDRLMECCPFRSMGTCQ